MHFQLFYVFECGVLVTKIPIIAFWQIGCHRLRFPCSSLVALCGRNLILSSALCLAIFLHFILWAKLSFVLLNSAQLRSLTRLTYLLSVCRLFSKLPCIFRYICSCFTSCFLDSVTGLCLQVCTKPCWLAFNVLCLVVAHLSSDSPAGLC